MASCSDLSVSAMNCSAPPRRMMVHVLLLGTPLKKLNRSPPTCFSSKVSHSPRVVDTIDIEDMGDKGVFCRCWKSKKFPYCDGSHSKHNTETGDNVGPLIVKKSA